MAQTALKYVILSNCEIRFCDLMDRHVDQLRRDEKAVGAGLLLLVDPDGFVIVSTGSHTLGIAAYDAECDVPALEKALGRRRVEAP